MVDLILRIAWFDAGVCSAGPARVRPAGHGDLGVRKASSQLLSQETRAPA